MAELESPENPDSASSESQGGQSSGPSPVPEGITRRDLMKAAVAGAVAASWAASPRLVFAQTRTIRYWTFLDPAADNPRSRAQSALVRAFESQHSGVKVDVQVLNWADIGPRLIQAVAAGTGPDVTRVTSDWFIQQFEAQTLLPLNNLIAQTPEAERADWLIPPVKHKGNIHTMQIEFRPLMLWYRRDHLASIGASVPTTWDELGGIGQRLRTQTRSGYAFGLSQAGQGHAFVESFKPTLLALGGDYLTAEGKAMFQNAAGQQAMKVFYDMVHAYQATDPNALNWDLDGLHQGFNAGRASMIVLGTHRVFTSRAIKEIGDNLQVAPIPGFRGKPAPALAAGWGLGIPRTSKQQELAWEFIRHMTSAESQIINARVGGEIPARRSAYRDPWFTTDPNGREMQKWTDYMQEHGRLNLYPPDFAFLYRLLVEAAQRVILKKEPIPTVLADAARQYDASKVGR